MMDSILRVESYIVFSLMQNTYLDQSILFCQNIDKQFIKIK